MVELADAVQKAAGAVRNPGDVVGRGADGAPTLRIDRVAEETVLQVLDDKGVRVDVLSEERGFVPRGGEGTLILDPIDGTHNAIRGVPAFAVSIAFGHKRLADVDEGLVRDLVTGATYYAKKGSGATLNEHPIRVRTFDPSDSVFTVYLGTHAHPEGFRVAGRARRVRNLGVASLDLCLVAKGAADLYYMRSATVDTKVRVVDIAAGILIVKEAGGDVRTIEGAPLDLPLRPDARTDLVAYGDPGVLEAIR